MKKLKICFISTDPTFLGGGSIFIKELINYLKNKELEFEVTCVYPSKRDREYSDGGIIFKEIKGIGIYPLNEIYFNIKLREFIKNRNFDIVNSHGDYGFWLLFYKKRANQKIIHTYHGTTYYFYKNQFKRFKLLKKVLYSPILLFSFFIGTPPMKRADKVICVSEHVKEEIEKLYGKRKNIKIIRTGVDLEKFKPRNKNNTRKELGLEKNKIYGLYVGRGGYWTKGLDKVIGLSKKLHNLDKTYRLLIIGSDKEKVKHLVNKEFVILLPPKSREEIPFYYNSAAIFFCLSRYEGGAPTLVTSEAMASGCLIVCSKDSKQEIIEDEKNGIIIGENYEKEAKRILNIFKSKRKKENIIKNSLKTAKELSLDKWGGRYLRALIQEEKCQSK